jgi:hypothetical protein
MESTSGHSLRTNLLKTATSFIETYNAWTIESILSIRSPSCIHQTLPASLGVPTRNNAEYATFLKPMLSIFRNLKFIIIDDSKTIVDVEARKVVLHCRDQADTNAGRFENEYIFILTMNKDGDLLDEIVEFIDSAYTEEFKGRMARVDI